MSKLTRKNTFKFKPTKIWSNIAKRGEKMQKNFYFSFFSHRKIIKFVTSLINVKELHNLRENRV